MWGALGLGHTAEALMWDILGYTLAIGSAGKAGKWGRATLILRQSPPASACPTSKNNPRCAHPLLSPLFAQDTPLATHHSRQP